MTLDAFIAKYPFLSDKKEALAKAGFETKADPFKIAAHFIKKGDLDALKGLIEAGYDVNSYESGDFGSSLLHNAIRYDQMAIFRYLLDNGADIDFQDAVGWTPLMEAIIDTKPQYGKMLVDKGCDQSLMNQRGVNAKMLAMKFGQHEFLVFLN